MAGFSYIPHPLKKKKGEKAAQCVSCYGQKKKKKRDTGFFLYGLHHIKL